MKRILMSVSMIAAVAVVTVGATRAIFSDSATNANNTFSAGNLVVSLDGDRGSVGTFFNETGMAPGDSVKKCVQIKNDGNMDQIFRVYATNITPSIAGFQNYFKVKITLNPSSGCVRPANYTAYGPSAPTLIRETTLNGITGQGNALNNISAAFEETPWPLMPKYVAMYEIEVTLDKSTPNTYQGATLKADLKVDATQYKSQEQDSIVW